MDAPDLRQLRLSSRHRAVVERFVAACWADERVISAFLGGSYARSSADAYSDLDLYLITTDETYADFFARRTAFIRQLGEPVFLEDFDAYGFDLLLFILSDGVEGELALGREGAFRQIHSGPYVALLDRTGLLAGFVFPELRPTLDEQLAQLHHLIFWFWHDLSHHFITAVARDQVWSAVGALEDMRRACVDLARLAANFTVAAEGYDQVERALPVGQQATMSVLATTFCPPERSALLHAAHAIVDCYRELAQPLAQAHGIAYPVALERVVCARLDALETPGGASSVDGERGN